MSILTGTTDAQARLVLPPDFASCEIVIERRGDQLRVWKAAAPKRRYTFAELVAG